MTPPSFSPDLPQGITLRPVDERTDLPFLLDLFASTREHLLQAVDLPPEGKRILVESQFNAQRSGFNRTFQDGTFNLILQHGVPIGQWYVDENRQRVLLVHAALIKSSRGHGIIAALTRQLAIHSRRQNKPFLASVEKHNPAREIWRHLGFHAIEDHATHERLEHHPYAVSLAPPLDGISLRSARAEDAQFRFELFKQARRRTFEAIPLPPEQLATLVAQQFDSSLLQWQNQHPQATCYLVLDGNQPVGEWYLSENQDTTYIVNAALIDSHQGKGISAALHRSLFARADRIGKPVRSHVEKGNPAKDILVHLGLKIVAEHDAYLELEYQTTIRGARQASITENSISSS